MVIILWLLLQPDVQPQYSKTKGTQVLKRRVGSNRFGGFLTDTFPEIVY
jgi:hypothetical protein